MSADLHTIRFLFEDSLEMAASQDYSGAKSKIEEMHQLFEECESIYVGEFISNGRNLLIDIYKNSWDNKNLNFWPKDLNLAMSFFERAKECMKNNDFSGARLNLSKIKPAIRGAKFDKISIIILDNLYFDCYVLADEISLKDPVRPKSFWSKIFDRF